RSASAFTGSDSTCICLHCHRAIARDQSPAPQSRPYGVNHDDCNRRKADWAKRVDQGKMITNDLPRAPHSGRRSKIDCGTEEFNQCATTTSVPGTPGRATTLWTTFVPTRTR